jgi:hypothetical protein
MNVLIKGLDFDVPPSSYRIDFSVFFVEDAQKTFVLNFILYG